MRAERRDDRFNRTVARIIAMRKAVGLAPFVHVGMNFRRRPYRARVFVLPRSNGR